MRSANKVSQTHRQRHTLTELVSPVAQHVPLQACPSESSISAKVAAEPRFSVAFNSLMELKGAHRAVLAWTIAARKFSPHAAHRDTSSHCMVTGG